MNRSSIGPRRAAGQAAPRRVSAAGTAEGHAAGLAFDPSGPGRGERVRRIAEGGP